MTKTKPVKSRAPCGVQDKFRSARDAMSSALIERDDEIDVVLSALLCGEHPLLVGPPGTGKTLLANSVAKWLDTSHFYYLLTKFTDPGEIFGPIDITALTKERKTQRAYQGYVADSVLVTFDEVFKASSAILNTTLNLLNERKFKCGLQEVECPLVMLVGLSNEFPQEQEELGALFDRFLFRKKVKYVQTKDGLERLLWDREVGDVQFTDTLSLDELHQGIDEARQLFFTESAVECMRRIITELRAAGIHPGDRRIRKSTGACRAFAYLQGHDRVFNEDLVILSHIFWDDPAEQPEKAAKIINKIANPIGTAIAEKLQEAESVVASCSPVDCVEKLKDIERALDNSPDDARKDIALKVVRQHIADAYSKSIGRKVAQ